MYKILLIPKNSAMPVGLYFKTRDAAEIAQKNIYNVQKGVNGLDTLLARDDFGHVITMEKENICYALFIDVDEQTPLQTPSGMEVPMKSANKMVG